MFCDFQTTTFGKWILAGEHAVLRGHDALVFPIKEKKLHFSYVASSPTLSADYTGKFGAEMHVLFWSVLEQGVQLLGGSLNQLSGHFHLNSNIPVGVGLGASAALCVAMSRWYCAQNMIKEHEAYDFAKNLEHLFHGTSSGLDIAGVSSSEGIYFKAGSSTSLQQSVYPNFYLSSCKQTGVTSHCIQQVQDLWNNNKSFAQELDSQMAEAVYESKSALEQKGDTAIEKLAKAINKACDCFIQWGLVSESLQQHIHQLKTAGALAVKPTGSGGGGYVLSLWENPPQNIDIELTKA